MGSRLKYRTANRTIAVEERFWIVKLLEKNGIIITVSQGYKNANGEYGMYVHPPINGANDVSAFKISVWKYPDTPGAAEYSVVTEGSANRIDISPDESKLIVGTKEHKIICYDLGTLSFLWESLSVHRNPGYTYSGIYCAKFSPYDDTIVSCDMHGDGTLLNSKNGVIIKHIANASSMANVHFLLSNQILFHAQHAVGYINASDYIAEQIEFPISIRNEQSDISHCRRFLASSSYREISITDLIAKQVLFAIRDRGYGRSDFKFVGNRYIVVMDGMGTIQVWDYFKQTKLGGHRIDFNGGGIAATADLSTVIVVGDGAISFVSP